MTIKRIPKDGLVGEVALREAAAGEFNSICELIRRALRKTFPNVDMYTSAIYVDRVVAYYDGRYFSYPYTITDANEVIIGAPVEVIVNHTPVVAPGTPMREAIQNAPPTESDAAGAGQVNLPGADCVFIEALAAEKDKPSRFKVRVIRSGLSKNGFIYPIKVLREAAPLFNNARVYVKGDEEHLAGKGKDVRQLIGRLSEATFVEANGVGEIHAVLDALDSEPVTAKIRESVQRGLADMFGLSIDASGASKAAGKFRECTRMDRIKSVDLIMDAGAGGQITSFKEAAPNQESTTMTRQQQLDFIRRRNAQRADSLAAADDTAVATAFREAVEADNALPAPQATDRAITQQEFREALHMQGLRSTARATIASSKLPDASKARVQAQFEKLDQFTEAEVTAAITAEGKYVASLVGSAHITGLGSEFIEAGEDQSDKTISRLDAFFDRTKRAQSFKAIYMDLTGDRQVTGRMENCNASQLREACAADFRVRQKLAKAAGQEIREDFREAISAATFGNVLGNSITRAMIRDYAGLTAYQDWRWLCDVVPVTDFRSQERTRIGGYGNLPAVAENAAYAALTSPTDEKATYAITKRGGIETVSLEAFANDDVGLLRRIPMSLATAAGRTLYEFIYDFMNTNAVIYDTLALAVAGHNNIGVAALDATSFAACRLRMQKQSELSSAKRVGISLRHLIVPVDLAEAAFNLFVRGTNNDDTFVQSIKPVTHVVSYWTDTNNWWCTADNSDVPLIELGFYNGQEDPDLFIQDLPTQGSLFSNDQIKYKIRHIYSGAVRDFRGFDGNIVP